MIVDLSFLGSELPSDFVLPLKWPKTTTVANGTRAKVLQQAIDEACAVPVFIDLVLALMRKPTWCAAEDRKTFAALQDAAVRLGKAVVHWCYDLSSGHLLRMRLAHHLSHASRFTQKDAPLFEVEAAHFEVFATRVAVPPAALESEDDMVAALAEPVRPPVERSIGVDQALRAMVIAQVLDAMDVGPIACDIPEAGHNNIWTTHAFLSDSLSALLRVATCITGAISHLHCSLLKALDEAGESRPKAFKSLTWDENAKTRDAHWRNYYAVIGLKWVFVRNLRDALHDQSFGTLIRAKNRIAFWSLRACLARTVGALMRYVKDPSMQATLAKMRLLGLRLSNVYLRVVDTIDDITALKDIGAITDVLECVSVKTFGMLHDGYMPATAHLPSDKPAVLRSAVWTWTMTADPKRLGLNCAPQTDTGVMGASDDDMTFSTVLSALSVALTQSENHMWAAAADIRSWRSLDSALPSEAAITNFLNWEARWFLTEDDIGSMYKDSMSVALKQQSKRVHDDVKHALAQIM